MLNLTVIFTFVNLMIVNYFEGMPVVLNHVSVLYTLILGYIHSVLQHKPISACSK